MFQTHGLAKSFEKSNGAVFVPRRNSTGTAVNVPLRLMEPLCDKAPSPGAQPVEKVRAGQQIRVLWGCPLPWPVLDESPHTQPAHDAAATATLFPALCIPKAARQHALLCPSQPVSHAVVLGFMSETWGVHLLQPPLLCLYQRSLPAVGETFTCLSSQLPNSTPEIFNENLPHRCAL